MRYAYGLASARAFSASFISTKPLVLLVSNMRPNKPPKQPLNSSECTSLRRRG